MVNRDTHEAIRQDLEQFWDAKLQRARERYIQASADLHRHLLENSGGTQAQLSPGVRRAEAEAFANYCRVLATFTELVATGKAPEPERQA
jgi:hypothetical protein